MRRGSSRITTDHGGVFAAAVRRGPKIVVCVQFFWLIDLLAILPFYLFSGVDLRSVRVLRLFRLVRALKLVRYARAIFTFFVLATGLGIISVPAGLVASALSRARAMEDSETDAGHRE